MVADPQKVALDIFGKDYVTSTTFDPTQLSKNENFGIVPSDTTLTVLYRVTNPTNSNAGVGAVSKVSSGKFNFKERQALAGTTVNSVIDSLEVNNEEPIVGNVSNPTSTELKTRVFDTFPTQNRAVTQADYENVAYRMPAKFGAISRCSVQRDPDSAKRNLNMYVISENRFGKLVTTNSTIKINLKTWLNDFRMINDTIDILDAFIANIGVEYIIKPSEGIDKFSLLNAANMALKEHFKTRFYIGEPLYISDLYKVLKDVKGILDVSKVKIVSKNSSQYSGTQFDINANLSPDGSYLITPANVILEVKFPATDIKGKIR